MKCNIKFKQTLAVQYIGAEFHGSSDRLADVPWRTIMTSDSDDRSSRSFVSEQPADTNNVTSAHISSFLLAWGPRFPTAL